MTASVRREVQSNPVSSALTAQLLADPQDAGSPDLGDLIEALGGGHEVGVEGHEHPRLTSEPQCIVSRVDGTRNSVTTAVRSEEP
jgi:hypothetical protein